MISEQMVPQLFGDEVCDRNGAKIGKVGQVYLEEGTGRPAWATVRTGLFGLKESFVPLDQASMEGDTLRVAVTKEQVSDAPRMDAAGRLSSEDEMQLYDYYGMRYPAVPGPRQDTQAGRSRTPASAHDRTAHDRHAADGRDDAMTRSEERLKVGAETTETGRVRLRKYVVTEEQQVTVPVRHEEVRIEREPITEANRDQAMSGAEISEAEHEVTLHAERPVVRTEAVPVERVRLAKETVTEEETVSGQVRKEQIEVTEEQARDRRDRKR
ncbi:PRC and DUF2382 domain-containing protein [Crossiella sp. SN42]|uniref:DUF2382 domain-containing protein n=1 Tax=Crossiella sp. SN42 TaxID=2944808 RepID=UPI00207CD5B5|nr:PRC and DUF2382 domain-containing protein [Crossiella sp. SN42]MCO1580131.1 PRC and DUF2382 domain-containing protein [Crossiella sp. SN42]